MAVSIIPKSTKLVLKNVNITSGTASLYSRIGPAVANDPNFICWVQVSTANFVAQYYFEYPSNASTNLFCTSMNGTRELSASYYVRCYYLARA